MGKSIKLKDDIYWDGSSIKGKLVIDDVECKNVLNITTISATANGVTYSYDSNTGIVTLNGTCTTDNSVITLTDDILTFDGDYTLSYNYVSGSISNEANTLTQIQFQSRPSYKGIIVKLSNESNSKTSSLSNLTINAFRIRFDNGVVFDNYKIQIQLEKGSVTTNFVLHKKFNNSDDIVNERDTNKTKTYSCNYLNSILQTKASVVKLGWGSSMSCNLYVGSIALILVNTQIAVCHRYSGGFSINKISGNDILVNLSGDTITVTKTDGTSFSGLIIYAN